MKLLPLTLLTLFLLFLGLKPHNANAQTFVYCSEASPTAFNPQITTDGTSNNATTHTIYNRLIEFKYGSTELVPALAQSWKVSKDNKTYTFNLRKNVSFHKTPYFTPTRSFNADDVIFSINRQRLKDHPYHKVGGGTYEYFKGMGLNKLIKSVKKLGPHKIQIVLKQPEAPFLANLAMSFMSIASKNTPINCSKKESPNNWIFLPVGTGPFVFKKIY